MASAQHLPRLSRHLDRGLETAVALLLGHERVRARQRHEARAEAHDRPAAAEGQRGGLGVDRDADRGQPRHEEGDRGRHEQQARKGDRPPTRDAPGPWRRTGPARRVADRLDGRTGRLPGHEPFVPRRRDEHDRRLGGALLPERVDDQAQAVRPHAHLDPRRPEA